MCNSETTLDEVRMVNSYMSSWKLHFARQLKGLAASIIHLSASLFAVLNDIFAKGAWTGLNLIPFITSSGLRNVTLLFQGN